MPERPDPIAEERIKALLLDRNPAALELLWDHYAGELLCYLSGLSGSRADAEDILQDVFLRIARKPGAVAGARSLPAYLFRMARNECYTHLKRRGRRERPAAEFGGWLEAQAGEAGPSGHAEAVAAALGRIPEEQRSVIVLNVYAGITFREIAERLKISAHTAASRYRYGVAKLRELLKTELYENKP
jgi:RNA polymerase sigma-70 factor (ECF subfamily)